MSAVSLAVALRSEDADACCAADADEDADGALMSEEGGGSS